MQKDNVICRQAAIDALKRKTFRLTFAEEQNCEGHVAWSADVVYSDVMEGELLELPSAQPERKWIPCSKQLPKQGQEVICQCRANIIKVLKLDAYGDWYQDAGHCYMGGFAIAWMPLPEPYKEGETT